MPKLEGLHIDLSDGEPPLSQVAGLRNLRELTISGLPTWGTVKVAVAPAARLTKLAVNHCQVRPNAARGETLDPPHAVMIATAHQD